QATAKTPQSSLGPMGPRMLSASRATPVRKSTNVPNTSKNSALMLIGCPPLSRLPPAQTHRSSDLDAWHHIARACRSRSRSRRLHALRLEHLGGGRAGERFDQGSRGVALLRLRAQSSRVDRVVLDFSRQRPDQRDAFHRQDFADLVNAELGLAARHM